MKKILYSIVVTLFFVSGCKEFNNGPFVDSGRKPAAVTSVEVVNTPGGARITYSLPDDPQALYVEAEYVTKGEGRRIVKSSVYRNYLELEGFVDTEERKVDLYVVNRSQKKSDPVEVTIKPLEAPIHVMFRSIQVDKDFGGANIRFHNEAKNEYVIYTLVKNSANGWEVYDRNYTSVPEGNYSIHGLPSKETEFAFLVRDEWENYSDTLFKTLTPLYEEEIDKSLWKAYPLDNDAYRFPRYSNRKPELMWDSLYTTSPYTTDPAKLPLPQWVTIDLGQAAVFSRANVKGFYRPGNASRVFSRETPKVYEIWGWAGNGKPSQDGSWDNWTDRKSVV